MGIVKVRMNILSMTRYSVGLRKLTAQLVLIGSSPESQNQVYLAHVVSCSSLRSNNAVVFIYFFIKENIVLSHVRWYFLDDGNLVAF